MKKVYNVVLFVCVCASSLFAQVPSHVPSNSLIAWYPFNGNANDGSGNGHNGTVNGCTITKDRFGNLSSFYFNRLEISSKTV